MGSESCSVPIEAAVNGDSMGLTNRVIIFLATALVLQQTPIVVRALQVQKSEEPDWAYRIETQHTKLMDKVDTLDQQVALLLARLGGDEANGTAGARIEIAGLKSTVTLILTEMSMIFGGVVTLILGGVGSAWYYIKRARILAVDMESQRARLKVHDDDISDKMDSVITHTNGMSKHLEEMSRAAGVVEGREQERDLEIKGKEDRQHGDQSD